MHASLENLLGTKTKQITKITEVRTVDHARLLLETGDVGAVILLRLHTGAVAAPVVVKGGGVQVRHLS